MYAGFYPDPRPVDEVIGLVGLEEKRNSRVNKLSGGQQRRLDVAIALAGNPELLFLDEPTTGFDPSARREAWEVIKNLAALGKTVLLTTHYMDEAQYLADRVAVISAGRIVAEGDPATLADRELARARIRYRVPDGATPPAGLAGPRGRRRVHRVQPRRRHRGAAPAHRVGARPPDQPGRARGEQAIPGGRLPVADRLRPAAPARTGARHERGGDDRLAGPLRQQIVLAEPGVGVLHLRVPAHVPGDLHLAARPLHRADRRPGR